MKLASDEQISLVFSIIFLPRRVLYMRYMMLLIARPTGIQLIAKSARLTHEITLLSNPTHFRTKKVKVCLL